MSSIATSIPTGVISHGPAWCLQSLLAFNHGSEKRPYEYEECANSTSGTQKSDFQTFCCDGEIIDTAQSWWNFPGHLIDYPLNLETLVCCSEGGHVLPGGLMPIDTDYTHCPDGLEGTPFASIAATNTKNAEMYLATYKDASADGKGGYEDWTRTETPSCLWVQTNHPMITMVDITVAAAEITTLPIVETDGWGNRVTITGSSSSGSTVTSSFSSSNTNDQEKTTFTGTVTKAPDDEPAGTGGVTGSTSSSTSDGVKMKISGVSLGATVILGLGAVALAAWMI